METIYRGEDKTIDFTLKNADGSAVDLDDLLGLVVIIYQFDKKTLAKYSKNALSGYDTIDITDAAAGKFSVKLQAKHTRAANLTEVFVEIKTQATQSGFDENKIESVVSDQSIAIIKDSITKALSSL